MEHLQAMVEQYDTTVEALKASNEEPQAINQALRSTTQTLGTRRAAIGYQAIAHR